MNRKALFTIISLIGLWLPVDLPAQNTGNKITLNAKEMALVKALNQVERQSGYYKMNYSVDDLRGYHVTADIREATVPQAVEQLIHGLPLHYAINGRLVVIRKQQRTVEENIVAPSVSGRVIDSEGEPLIGVTVKVKGTDTGVITDTDGNYTLQGAQKGDLLEFSYIGKQTLERRINGKQMTIILEDDAQTLKDVVVTGYQTISKERATGSFAKVTAEDLKGKRHGNLSQLLEGEIAGFNTNSGLIRGTTTMNGVTQPLYVIDGFPVENTSYNKYGSLEERLPNLTVEDIESITVLKDAAAASIYGARAANGVVVIVTKKARKGQKAAISFDASLTWHPYSFHEKRLTDAAAIIGLERQWASDNPNLQGSDAQTYAQSLIDNKVYTSQGILNILDYYAGNQTQTQMESKLAALAARGYQYYKDVEKYAKRDALYQQYHLSVGHGAERNNFMASISYRNNKMNDKFTSDNSWGVDLKDMLDVTSRIHLEAGAYLYFQKANDQTFDPMNPSYSYMPYDRLVDEDGSPYVYTQESRLRKSTLDIIRNNSLYNMDITPMEEIGRNIRTTNTFTSRTHLKLNFDITGWLKYNIMFQYGYGTVKGSQLYDRNSYYVRNLVNQYATHTNAGTVFNVPYGHIYYRESNTTKSYTFRQQLNLDKTFADRHNIVALLGHEVRKNIVDYDNSTLYNYDPEMLTFSLIEQNTLNQTAGLMGGNGLTAHDFTYLRYVDNRYISFYMNAAYTFDDRYMASASIRWDRSNLWGTSSKYQKKPIWSIGGAWNMNKEQWFDVSWIDRLKLRVSHGIAGNVAKDAAPYMTATYTPNYNVGGTKGSISARPNPNLRWEKTTTTNIALDFALLKNRVDGSVEYYDKRGSDLLANTMGVPTEGFGYSTYKINNGKMTNKGVELTLNGRIVQTRDFGFNASVAYSHNNNKVTYVNVTAPIYILQFDYPEAYPVVGNPYTSLYTYKWAGLSKDGLPQVYDSEGQAVTSNPRDLAAIVYAGTTEPVNMASLNLNLAYKGFDFSMLWVYRGGHKMRNTDIPMLGCSYNSSMMSYIATIAPVNSGISSRWLQSGDETATSVPRAVFGESNLFSGDSYDIYRYADINVVDATNVRLANVSVAWNLPSRWLRGIRINAARLQLNVENAATFTKNRAAKYLLNGYEAPNYTLGLYVKL